MMHQIGRPEDHLFAIEKMKFHEVILPPLLHNLRVNITPTLNGRAL
jgi:hypothetical protein